MPEKLWLGLAHLGVGLIPGPGGTYGSLVGIGLFVLIHYLWPPGVWLLFAGAALLGLPAASRAEKVYGQDANCIVIDEVAGQALTLLFLPAGWKAWLAGFLVFRLFDIAKFWPLSRAERLGGGLGVMADDLAAGVLAGLAVLIAWRLLGW